MGIRILIATIPARGHVFPTLAVAEELVRRGNDVIYVTTEEFAPTIAATGAFTLLYSSVDPVSTVQTDDAPMAFFEENRRVLRTVEEHFAAGPADVVLYDSPMTLAGRILAKSWGRPGIELTPVFASNEHYNFMEQALAASGLQHDEAAVAPYEEYARRAAELLGEYGIDTPPHESPAGVDELNVVYVPRAFQPQGDTFGDGYAFVGPCVGERAFLGEWQPPASGLPVVLASLGTTYNDNPEFFRTCARAFEGRPWHLVISVGQRVDPASLGPLPDNVEVRQWLPHVTVLRHAKVFLTHGGMGSVLESLTEGCPLVLVPAWPDVQVIADRAVELNLGRMLPPGELTAERLRDMALAVAGDETIAAGVAAMREQIRLSGGASRAADEVEAHAKRAG
ncbi:macrolide family glycosyltransferase [Dactylosporangium sp. NPDC048998]|uniref:macrolide family glycosyltransferase n=1 Tax=Dactylosporangium sp. NPDC048998 TaxID=3363976 RepID=UPI0037131B20